MGTANGLIPSTRLQDFSKMPRPRNTMRSSTSLWWQWVLLGLASLVRLTSTLLIMQMHQSLCLLHCHFMDATLELFYIEFEQQRELREKGFQKINDHNVHEEPAEKESVEMANDHIDKVSARVRFKPDFAELPSLEEEEEFNEDNTDSAIGMDGSSHTSESLYAEKHDISSTNEVDSLKSTISGELSAYSLSQNNQPEKRDVCGPQPVSQGSNDWVHGWSSDYSMDNELATAYDENGRLKGSLEVAEASIQELKLEVGSLQSHADELGAETQRVTLQLAAEIASGEELAREVSILKSECSKLKDGFQELKHSKQSKSFTGMEAELFSLSSPFVQVSSAGKICNLSEGSFVHDLQMKWQRGLLLMEDKVREIQNKACLTYHERDMGFLHSDLEVLDSVLQDFKEGTAQLVSMLNAQPIGREAGRVTGAASALEPEQFVPGGVLGIGDADLYLSEGNLHSFSRPGQISSEFDPIEDNLDATDVMKGKICELLSELEESKAERGNLIKKMDQMECYYEALIQELEESQRQMVDELQNLRNEHSACLYTITTFKSQVETMQQDMNEQFLRFAEERRGLESQNKELERRAISSETALKRLRLNYSIAVGQLQKDLELLSFQVLSMFETNKNLARQALSEASQLCFPEYTEENAEEPCSWSEKDDSETAFLKEQYKSRVQSLKVGVAVPWRAELSSQLNGPPVKLIDTMIHNVDHILDEKGMSLKEVPMHAEMISKDGNATLSKLRAIEGFTDAVKEGDAGINGLRLENAGQVAVPYTVIPEMKNLLLHADLAAEQKKKLSDAEVLLEDMKRSLRLQEELHKRAEAELSEMHLLNLHLEVFSNILQETLREANDGIRLMEGKADELVEQLERTTEFKEMLMSKLQAAKHELEALRKSESRCMAKCEDLRVENHTLEAKLQHISDENGLLTQEVTECGRLLLECRSYKSMYEACTAEKNGLENFLEQESFEKHHLRSEILSLNEELETLKAEFDRQSSEKGDLEKTVMVLQDKLGNLRSSMVSYNEQTSGLALADKSFHQELKEKNFETTFLHLEELQRMAHEQILQLSQEKKDIMQERNIVRGSLSSAESKILFMNQKFDSDLKDMVTKLDVANIHGEKLQLELQDVSYKLSLSLQAEEKYAEQNRELSSKLTLLETELQRVTSENRDFAQKILTFDSVNKELERTKLAIIDCRQENEALMISLQAGNEDSVQLANELSSLNESLRCARDEFLSTRDSRDELEATVTVLTSQLNEKHEQMLSFKGQEAELVHLRQEVSDLEFELSKVKHLLFQSEQCQRKADEETSFLRLQVIDLETNLATMHEFLLAADVEVVFIKNQFQIRMKELLDEEVSDLEFKLSKVNHLLFQSEQRQRKADEEASFLRLELVDLETNLATMHEFLLAADVEVVFIKNQFQIRMKALLDRLNSLERNNVDICLKHLDVVTTLNARMAIEAQCVEENAELMTALQSLRSELETVVSEKRVLEDYVDKRSAIWAEFENYKAMAAVAEVDSCQQKHRHEVETEQLKSRLVNFEEEMDNLRSSRDELEITVVVLRSKLDELHAQLSLLQECDDELMKLRNENNDLTHRLSEQVFKTEEFKNLSIHLKELKDRADAEHSQVREKREIEGPSFAVQESLRIAFIREQCETKLQELRSQLYISKKHGEEMLLKLQDALDELENRKKGEASQAKRNEELSKKILELETELQTVLTDKREKVRAYDRMKAELECSMLSLDCCKEEKLTLESSLQECNEERTRMAMELNSMKERLESSASSTNITKQGNHEPGGPNAVFVQPLAETGRSLTSEVQSWPGMDTVNMVATNDANKMGGLKSSDTSLVVGSCQDELSIDEGNQSSSQDALASKSFEVSRLVRQEKEGLLQNNMNTALINGHFREQCLKSSMERLHKELERMKNENLTSLLPQDEHHSDPAFQGLQRELLQLHMANEQLGSIFPLFNEFSGSGNALERVLALEIELAEALQAKKKSSIHFQSSFLKQHNDEEAVFQSFRDINELIKDMLQVKRRYTAVETELKEMQERYSQLSLQFAEVEGERQQLVMTLKNVRPPKKA
ncbi:uncharacterized protein LOC131242191 isoform X2 [Magnolia sinica]|uniref:uncharacterized protein LOC131242191 isoform X2 n=1 Tax=Magnolia sinica TaxID=86752 RepID=UPI00265A636F|nr:uncharacterized protein LOC131242191 isoform X2 [Magnolia sinica]